MHEPTVNDEDELTNWLKFANWVVSLPRVTPVPSVTHVPERKVLKQSPSSNQGFRDDNPGKPVTVHKRKKKSLKSRLKRFVRVRVYRLKKTLRRGKRKFARLTKPYRRSGRALKRAVGSVADHNAVGDTSPKR